MANVYEPTEVATVPDECMESAALAESRDDAAPELDWLVAELTIDREQSAELLEEVADLMRALFSAGALPGEVRAFVAEVFSPPSPRVTARASRHPRYGVLPGAFDLRPGPGGGPG